MRLSSWELKRLIKEGWEDGVCGLEVVLQNRHGCGFRAPHTSCTILYRNLSPRILSIHGAIFALPNPPPLNPHSPPPSSLNQYELDKIAAFAKNWLPGKYGQLMLLAS
ncbi:hypothetical protein ACFX13_030694 [Malus domestica]